MIIIANTLYLCMVVINIIMVIIATFSIVETTSSSFPKASISFMLTSWACAPKFSPKT